MALFGLVEWIGLDWLVGTGVATTLRWEVGVSLRVLSYGYDFGLKELISLQNLVLQKMDELGGEEDPGMAAEEVKRTTMLSQK